MGAALKEVLGPEAIAWLATQVSGAWPVFDAVAFTRDCHVGLDEMGLMERAHHLARCLHDYLPKPFPLAAQVLSTSFGPQCASDGSGLDTLRYLPHSCFVQRYGLNDIEASLQFQHALTQRFTAEFSIRAFLATDAERTWRQLEEWALDPNVHVRRLVSEGTRTRLPWAPRVPTLTEQPLRVLALLERLKDDSERYVQRSVANSLNDLAKDHPQMVIETAARWLADAPVNRQWIVRHGLRTLIKQGNREALALLGVSRLPEVAVSIPAPRQETVLLGDSLALTFHLASTSATDQDLLVDYRVHFVKANGTTRPKVFKLRRLTLKPGEQTILRASVSFAAMTTRRHYPGPHHIELLINGVAQPAMTCTVITPPATVPNP